MAVPAASSPMWAFMGRRLLTVFQSSWRMPALFGTTMDSRLSLAISPLEGTPAIVSLGGAARRRLSMRHKHTGIVLPVRFDWSSGYSWFSLFANKRVLGVKGMAGTSPC